MSQFASGRISDLALPDPTLAQSRKMEFFEDNPVSMTSESVLRDASRVTRLENVGEQQFQGRLRAWLEIADAEDDRTELGRAMIRQLCVRFVSTRLRFTDLISRNPQILDETIEAPIVIVGPFRSGTTHLVNLLAADSRLRSLPLWESYEPIRASNLQVDEDMRIRRETGARAWHELHEMLPMLRAMRPVEPDHVHEDVELFGPDFGLLRWETLAIVRPWPDVSMSHADQLPHYIFMRDMLKALQWQRGPRRWVLKAPHHAEHLDVLMKVFPDATVVVTYRDPLAIVSSVATLAAYLSRLEYRAVDLEVLGEYWMDRIDRLLRGGMNGARFVPERQLVEVDFQDFMIHKLDVVRKVYESADLEIHLTQLERMNSYLSGHPRKKDGQIVYDLARDFNIAPVDLRERFSYYYERYPGVNV
ncbi:sulfotransferase family protein [Prauserella marina]|uniref:sulfotransferase family protein n=1 Tax=Prauserella marina TaxID=530584 RepID=UPI00147600E6|nr:sulfotransferase [Prauserella marina]